MRPAKITLLFTTAAQDIHEATTAAGTCEELSRDIWHIAVHRLPSVCELLRLGSLSQGELGAEEMTEELLQRFKTVCDALHKASTEAQEYLQSSTARPCVLSRSASLKRCLKDTQKTLLQCLADMTTPQHINLAGLLRSWQSAQQAQHTAALMRELQEQVRQVRGAHAADKKWLQAQARAALERQAPGGQVVKVSGNGAATVMVAACGGTFATVASVCYDTFNEVEDKVNAGAAVWDAATGTGLHRLRKFDSDTSLTPRAWSPDLSKVAMGSYDLYSSLEVWDVSAGIRWCSLGAHSKRITSVAWSPDGSRVATASADCTAAVWDASTGMRMHELGGHTKCVTAVAWSPDGSKVVTGSADRTAVVSDVSTGARSDKLRGHGGACVSVAWSPDGCRIAARFADSTIAVWEKDVATGAFMHVHVLHGLRSVAWSPDGSHVVTVATDGSAAVRDAGARVCMHELRGHSGAVTKAAWSPDGSRVAMLAEDKTAVVWDARSGARMHVLSGHKKEVTSVAWSPDGATVYTSSLDGTVRVYGLAGRAALK